MKYFLFEIINILSCCLNWDQNSSLLLALSTLPFPFSCRRIPAFTTATPALVKEARRTVSGLGT
jgi:hypothetical protein